MESMENINKDKPNINRATCILFYLSKKFDIEMEYLYKLYKRYGNDTFYIFYMLSGKSISIPKVEKLANIFSSANNIHAKLTGDPYKKIVNKKDLKIYKELQELSLNSK